MCAAVKAECDPGRLRSNASPFRRDLHFVVHLQSKTAYASVQYSDRTQVFTGSGIILGPDSLALLAGFGFLVAFHNREMPVCRKK